MAQQLNVQYIRFYTEGSAARKVAPVVPLETLKLPKIHKCKKTVIHFDPVTLLAVIVPMIMLVLMAVGTVRLNNARVELNTMASYVDTLQAEHETLQATYEAGYDLEKVEKTALALGMVPADQLTRVSIEKPAVQTEVRLSAWERFCTFLTGLFA